MNSLPSIFTYKNRHPTYALQSTFFKNNYLKRKQHPTEDHAMFRHNETDNISIFFSTSIKTIDILHSAVKGWDSFILVRYRPRFSLYFK